MQSALLLLAAVVTASSEEALALQDRQQFPPADIPYIYYITTAPAAPDGMKNKAKVVQNERTWQRTALNFVFPHLTPKQYVLERCLPVPISDTLYRIDIRTMGWNIADWHLALKDYPYAFAKLPIVIRADWLIIRLTDSQESEAYYRLVFGKVPKDRAEAFATFGVNPDPRFQAGLVEGASPVSVKGRRKLINYPTNQRGDAWLTEDSLKLDDARDPLENLEGGHKHDGEEFIARFHKIVQASGATGSIPAYALFNGEGVTVNRAPTDLVVDYKEARRGLPEIRNGIGCMVCHETGWNLPTKHEVRDLIAAGVDILGDPKTADYLAAFYLGDAIKEMKRGNEDFAAIIEPACGCDTKEAVRRLKLVVQRYDAPLTPGRAAHELSIPLRELEFAISWASKNNRFQRETNISGLAHGKDIPRDAWESKYLVVRQYVDEWRQTQ